MLFPTRPDKVNKADLLAFLNAINPLLPLAKRFTLPNVLLPGASNMPIFYRFINNNIYYDVCLRMRFTDATLEMHTGVEQRDLLRQCLTLMPIAVRKQRQRD